jgi:hypothetical protein
MKSPSPIKVTSPMKALSLMKISSPVKAESPTKVELPMKVALPMKVESPSVRLNEICKKYHIRKQCGDYKHGCIWTQEVGCNNQKWD